MSLKHLYSRDAWQREFELSQERIPYWGLSRYDEEPVYRVPFDGKTTKGHPAMQCPDCDVSKGYRHLRGCSEELCRMCDEVCITCDCRADANTLFGYVLGRLTQTGVYFPIFPVRPCPTGNHLTKTISPPSGSASARPSDKSIAAAARN